MGDGRVTSSTTISGHLTCENKLCESFVKEAVVFLWSAIPPQLLHQRYGAAVVSEEFRTTSKTRLIQMLVTPVGTMLDDPISIT